MVRPNGNQPGFYESEILSTTESAGAHCALRGQSRGGISRAGSAGGAPPKRGRFRLELDTNSGVNGAYKKVVRAQKGAIAGSGLR
jgi:hypothetical protein